ncbi:hypothetical protein ABZW18_05900 [Streptomyces sp. NPDC004647]|uniref:hypothetical protein n=1 Tax=Streptomyces sp. NPDC004647 TaxID=3154671 RepID=UPI00339FE7E4
MCTQRFLAAALVSVSLAGMSIMGASSAQAATSIDCIKGGGKVGIVVTKFHHSFPVCRGGAHDGEQVFIPYHRHAVPVLSNVDH